MTDHPSWLPAEDGASYRAVRCGTSVWALACAPMVSGGTETTAIRLAGRSGTPEPDVLDPAALSGPKRMLAPLRALGIVARWRNRDLWDALATSIRQVIRAGQARKLYRAFCQAHGAPVTTPLGDAWLFPTPETVLTLPAAEYARLGLAFKRRPLRAAAEALVEFGAKWAELSPSDLLAEVQVVPRIWFPLNALPERIIDYPAAGIRAYRDGAPFSIRGWTTSECEIVGGDTVTAISDRYRQISEHPPRRMHPRPVLSLNPPANDCCGAAS